MRYSRARVDAVYGAGGLTVPEVAAYRAIDPTITLQDVVWTLDCFEVMDFDLFRLQAASVNRSPGPMNQARSDVLGLLSDAANGVSLPSPEDVETLRLSVRQALPVLPEGMGETAYIAARQSVPGPWIVFQAARSLRHFSLGRTTSLDGPAMQIAETLANRPGANGDVEYQWIIDTIVGYVP